MSFCQSSFFLFHLCSRSESESQPLADLGPFVTMRAPSDHDHVSGDPASRATASSAAASSTPASVPEAAGGQSSEPKKLPLEVRRAQLRKYELFMLDVDGLKKAEYEKLFSEKKFFEVKNTAYRAWLLYKIDAKKKNNTEDPDKPDSGG